MLPLVKLVRDVVDGSGMGLREFAKVRGISYSTLRKYHDASAQPLRQGLRPATIKDLASALDVPRSTVEIAADASVGRVVREQLSPTASAMVALLGDLSPKDREVLRKTLDDYDR